MKFSRQIRYFYWRLIRLRGDPKDLALGLALGIFVGILPIVPFQTALAVFLAIVFKGSKITAALGTWISNPLNWYLVYYLDYRIGAAILGLSEKSRGFSAVMKAISQGKEGMELARVVMGSGGSIIAALILGGVILGLLLAPASYPLSLELFRRIHRWRETRRTFKALSRKGDGPP